MHDTNSYYITLHVLRYISKSPKKIFTKWNEMDKKSKILQNFAEVYVFLQKTADFTEGVMAVKSCIRLVPNDDDDVGWWWERMLLLQVLMLFVVLMVLSLFSAVAHEVWSGQHSVQHWYLGFAGNLTALSYCSSLLTVWLIIIIISFWPQILIGDSCQGQFLTFFYIYLVSYFCMQLTVT